MIFFSGPDGYLGVGSPSMVRRFSRCWKDLDGFFDDLGSFRMCVHCVCYAYVCVTYVYACTSCVYTYVCVYTCTCTCMLHIWVSNIAL